MLPRMGDHDSVRGSYDTVAEEYLTRLRDELAGKPLDRALLKALVEQTDGVIADLGCGPGHVTAWLAEQGATTVGVDLSPGMVAVARNRFPSVEFRVGDLVALPGQDGEFAAAVALYSIIHVGPDELAGVFAEVRRVLRPDALFLVSFHIGDEVRHLDEWWGHDVNVDFRFLDPTHIADLLESTGFSVEMRMQRTNYAHEVETQRAYILARRT